MIGERIKLARSQVDHVYPCG